MRCVFVGTPGFLGRIDGATRCGFWAGDPEDHGFDPKRLIDIDLGCTPSAAAAEEIPWEAVQVDDCFTGPNGSLAGTTIGPRWPELRLAGAVYLERAFVASLPTGLRPTCPPEGLVGHRYEYITAVYWPHRDDPRAGRRYAGHHAEIIDERGSLIRVAVYPPGRSADSQVRAVTMWIDVASCEQCDAGPDSLTTIGIGAAPKRGALFLINGELGADPDLASDAASRRDLVPHH